MAGQDQERQNPPRGHGGETHQKAKGSNRLTTNQGLDIADNQNSLHIGQRGPMLMKDFIFREKLTHFDHERIPERVVHARGAGAHGYFQAYRPLTEWTRAAFLQDPEEKTPVFVRFSTVAGSLGSMDVARDVRGFAVKLYTREGIFDLVGNNIPVFFIQDAIKFPDVIHSVKPEPDRGFPQAQSAHDTFWDFVSMHPESMHMLMWVMSDRAIPRSFRMMEGFGVHTFRFVNAQGHSTFVKFHWRPKLGSQSVLWDEALKLNGADPDFHRRDLWNAIESGDYPEFELCVQAFDQATADSLDFDVLDPTKIIPEETVPLEAIGKMVLDRNPDNFFAETEQVAFCPSHIVPGVDFTNDPLLNGRLHSYIDTQLSRLGGPNFHELPINKPVCPMRNFQRDAMMQMERPTGRVAYDPSSLDADGPRESDQGFVSYPEYVEGEELRIRPESFADHYSQARLFWKSMTEPEQRHLVNGFSFELGKCPTVAIRRRMLGHLQHTHPDLAGQVAAALGMTGEMEPVEAAVAPRDDLPASPALSIVGRMPESIAGRKIGMLLTDGCEDAVVNGIRDAATAEGAQVEIVAPRIYGVTTREGTRIEANHALSGGPSVLFDAVVVAPSDDGVQALLGEAAAIDWLHDAYAHLKVIGHVPAAKPLFDRVGIDPSADEGLVSVADGTGGYIEAARRHRIWAREPRVGTPG